MPDKNIYGGSEKDYSGIMSKPSTRPTKMFEAAARPQVKEKVQQNIKQEVQRKQQAPQGPAGFSGGKWNVGFNNDEDSLREKLLDDYDVSQHQHLVNTVKKYSKPWLGASSQWANYHDDMQVTKAAKFSLSFMGKLLGATWELPMSHLVGDPATNIHKQMQDSGLALKHGEKRVTNIINRRTGQKTGRTYTTIGGDPMKTGTDIMNTATLATGIYYAPSIFTLGRNFIVGGYKKAQSFFKPKEPIKGIEIDNITNASVGAQYKPQKFTKTLSPNETPPEINGYTGFVTLVDKNGKQLVGTTVWEVQGGQSGFRTTVPATYKWTDGKYYIGHRDNHSSLSEPLSEVVVYHKNTPSILTEKERYFDDRKIIGAHGEHVNTTDNSGVILKNHLDEIYQTNQSFVEGVPIINKFLRLELTLNELVAANYANKTSKIRKMLDAEGINPQTNPSMFKLTLDKNNNKVWTPKIMYHSTSRVFTDGLKGDAIKISSVEDSAFIGWANNADDAVAYITSTETLGAGEIVPRMYIGIPKFKKTFDVQRNANDLEFAVNHIAEQRFNHFNGKKVLNFDNFDTPNMVYQAEPPGSGAFSPKLQFMNHNGFLSSKHVNNWKDLTKKEWADRVRYELTRREYGDADSYTDISNWQQLEVELRVFGPDGNITPKHVLQENGFDSFVTIETTKFSGKPVQNIMSFEPNKNIIPISQAVDKLNPQKYSQFLSQELMKPNVSYGGGWQTIGQYMHKWKSKEGLSLSTPDVETGEKLIIELLGDARDVINQPTTPFTDAKQQLSSEFV